MINQKRRGNLKTGREMVIERTAKVPAVVIVNQRAETLKAKTRNLSPARNEIVRKM
jgi:hypothetical protein